MPFEIEYRYLLPSMPDLGGIKPVGITQGYLSKNIEQTKRVRIDSNGKATLTIKGKKVGATAEEAETIIPIEEARSLLAQCGLANTLTKNRYKWPSTDGFTWEIDVFEGKLAGLIIAEIELPAEDTSYQIPDWMNGVDITTDRRFANAALVDIDRDELLTNIARALNR